MFYLCVTYFVHLIWSTSVNNFFSDEYTYTSSQHRAVVIQTVNIRRVISNHQSTVATNFCSTVLPLSYHKKKSFCLFNSNRAYCRWALSTFVLAAPGQATWLAVGRAHNEWIKLLLVNCVENLSRYSSSYVVTKRCTVERGRHGSCPTKHKDMHEVGCEFPRKVFSTFRLRFEQLNPMLISIVPWPSFLKIMFLPMSRLKMISP